MKRLLIIIFLSFFVFSCGSKKTVITKKSKKETAKQVVVEKTKPTEKVNTVTETSKISSTEAYIEAYKAIAQKEMTLYNIPASITLAQGILESASGKGRLSVEANNHFGIKCHTWTGAKIYHDDDKKGECFRKYNSPKYSFRDHSLFLSSRKRYASLFDLEVSNYKSWARGLKAAGYATDKKYPQKLISLIERYELYKYDDEVLGRNPSERKFVDKSEVENEVHKVVKGDTLYNISKRYNVTVKELQALNNMKGTSIAIGQELKVK
ncbi:glucosaminidase domain-containing protein [Hyunsoonleella pacifica]|uniref:Peptidoglycan hydrolase n=1 Tax=Hyunsoonleella pacifica TaxID=1080224 RepID=A0A4Q9FMC0_9FLAO|nr:glucosaminidase domain-containing protein [Hyunsoonleella pacifica]TBN14306.1 LysM peptidoglycan-binding domain-containing protein [Hyunsoonleella pacifica]GGD12657.1 hemagglutinin [Hyunsoonleella pacifica]